MRFSRFIGAAKVGAIDAAGVAVAAVGTLALVFGAILPLNARNRQLAAHFQTAARERQRVAGIVTEIRTLTNDVAKMRTRVAQSPLRMLTQQALNQRLADLAALSSTCDLRVEDLKPGERHQMTHLMVVPIRMTGHGTYRNCAAFIHLLHERQADIDVHAFKLSGNPDDPGSLGNFDFELRWLAAPQEISNASPMTTASLP